MDPVVVELSAWTQRMPTVARGSLRRRSVASLIVGGLLGLVAVGGLVASLVLGRVDARLLGLAFLGVAAFFMIWNALRYLRHLPAGADEAPVQFAAPYAFVISDDALHFPGRFDSDPEDWPLADTVVVATAGRSGGSLVLRCPGRKSRRFFGKALVLPPSEISRLVEERRGALLA